MKDKIRDILNKGKAENSSRNDMLEMFAFFRQPAKEFEIKEILLEELSDETECTQHESSDFKSLFIKIWGEIEKNRKLQNKKVWLLYNILKVAAVIIAGMVIGILISYPQKDISAPVYYSALAPKGSVSELILPDGSIIYLNADSKIKYSVDGTDGTREVFLEGEAWFDVEKNQEKPFVVRTAFYDINVTGTQFNVNAYAADNLMTTTLEEGQIIIQSTDNFKIAENIVINPGEQVILDKNSNELSIKEVNTKWFTSWKDNKLIFVNMNLKELVILLERKYGVEIEIKNTEILDLHFDGTIKNESIIEFLEIIQNTLPIHYKIIGQKIEITNKN